VRLTCADCRRENEPERIYCHGCGARLDHSALPRKDGQGETPEEVHQRVSGMFDGRRDRGRALARKWAKLIVGAGLAAMVVVMLLPPANLPPAKKSETLPPQISLDLESLTQYRKPPQLRYSEDEINAYLAYILGRKKEKLNHFLLDFERAVVGFQPGRCGLTVGRSIFGYSIYLSNDFNVENVSGKVRAISTGGAIGRLSIHPALMEHASFLFNDIAAALERERKLIARTGSVQVGDKAIIFTP
jgi:hypothetical protein